MTVNWTAAARDDLASIRRYISQENPQAARKVVLSIIVVGDGLMTMPHRGRDGRVPGTGELVLTKLPYTIAYRTTNDGADILRIIHHVRLWPDMV